MAQRHVIELVDDLDQTLINNNGGAHTFALDGRTYDIDLTDENAEKLSAALAPFIAVARRSDKPAPRVRGRARTKSQTDAIREWARANGYDVSDRGRIAESIIEAYKNASGEPRADEPARNKKSKKR